MRESFLYQRLSHHRVKCNICERRCLIPEGTRGWCKTRINEGGKLFTLIWGEVSTLAVSPAEKKPFHHFLPGSLWLSVGSLGCNFRCPGCQNYEIAHEVPYPKSLKTNFISPQALIRMAKKRNVRGISWTYNEPTLWFEYTLEGAKLAKKEGLFTNYVTNGYITPEALDLIGPWLDVFRVDIKGFSKDTYRILCHIPDFKPILEATRRAKFKWKIWVEVVTNVIPGYNDDEDQLWGIANWISTTLGKETPWHVTRFYPYLLLSEVEPTPISTLEKARSIGFEAGLKYVYLGNVPGHRGNHTYCPRCKKILIRRDNFSILGNRVKEEKCPWCEEKIEGKWSV